MVVRHADRQVGIAVAVEVAACERRAEVLERAGCTLDAGNILVPQLVVLGPKALGRAIDYVDGAAPAADAELFLGYADREIVIAVAVEVRFERRGGGRACHARQTQPGGQGDRGDTHVITTNPTCHDASPVPRGLYAIANRILAVSRLLKDPNRPGAGSDK